MLGVLQSLFEKIRKNASKFTVNTYNIMINWLKRYVASSPDTIGLSEIDGNMANNFQA